MPLMREVKTPFKLFRIQYFKDEHGQYYKKIGDQHRRRVRPFWKKKRVWLGIPLIVLLALGYVGYRVGIDMASEKVVKEVSKQISAQEIQGLLKDPSVQTMIEKELGASQKQEIYKKYSVDPALTASVSSGKGTAVNNQTGQESTNGSATSKDTTKSDRPKQTKLQFKSRQEVMKFLLSKFSMAELSQLAKKADGGLTPEEKTEIKNTILSRISGAEYEALKIYALIEVGKGNM